MGEQHIERYWRDATPADSIKDPPMVARFRDEHYTDWVIGKLIYWDRSETAWHCENGHCYERCQVYDAPDPGEGWRLIDVQTEKPQVGDQSYDRFRDRWIVRLHAISYHKTVFYRRRIAPNVDTGEPVGKKKD